MTLPVFLRIRRRSTNTRWSSLYLCAVVGCKKPWKENSLISRRIGDFFYLPGAFLTFFGLPGYKFQSTQFFYPERLFSSIVGSASGKPGETGRGGCKKNQKIGEFSFQGILQPTTDPSAPQGASIVNLPPTLTSSRPPTRVWEVVRTVAAPSLGVFKCGGWGSSYGHLWCCSCRVVWCVVVVLFLSCRVLCCPCCVFVCVTCFLFLSL